jgi:hypothetical protein
MQHSFVISNSTRRGQLALFGNGGRADIEQERFEAAASSPWQVKNKHQVSR